MCCNTVCLLFFFSPYKMILTTEFFHNVNIPGVCTCAGTPPGVFWAWATPSQCWSDWSGHPSPSWQKPSGGSPYISLWTLVPSPVLFYQLETHKSRINRLRSAIFQSLLVLIGTEEQKQQFHNKAYDFIIVQWVKTDHWCSRSWCTV